MADKEPSVKSDANDVVSKFEKTLDTFMSNYLARLEKLETRSDDSFSGKEGKPASDSEPQMLDKTLSDRMDSISKRLDAFESKMGGEKKEEPKEEGGDGVTVKVSGPGEGEGGEEKKAEKEPVPEEAKPAEMASDKSDAAGGGEAQTGDGKTSKEYLGEERGENNLKVNDSARSDAQEQELLGLRARIAQLESNAKGMSDETSASFAAAQAEADKVYHAFGDAKGAPRWANGETLPAYIRRISQPFKQHSADWKDEDLTVLPITALQKVATRIYSDAMTVSKDVDTVGVGQLRMIKEVCPDTNRVTRKFVGDPEACWGMFKMPPRIITGISVKS